MPKNSYIFTSDCVVNSIAIVHIHPIFCPELFTSNPTKGTINAVSQSLTKGTRLYSRGKYQNYLYGAGAKKCLVQYYLELEHHVSPGFKIKPCFFVQCHEEV